MKWWGDGELVFNGDRVLILQHEKILAMSVGAWLRNTVNELNTAEIHT